MLTVSFFGFGCSCPTATFKPLKIRSIVIENTKTDFFILKLFINYLIVLASSSYFLAISGFDFLYVSASARIAGLYLGLILRHIVSNLRARKISLSINNSDIPTYASKYFLPASITLS